MYDTADMSCDH